MQLEFFKFTLDEMSQLANVSLKTVIESLIDEGVMTKQQGEEWMKTHAAVVYKKGFFNSLFEGDFFKQNNDRLAIEILKRVTKEKK